MEAPKLIKSIDELAVAKAEQKCPKSSEAFNHLVKYYTISLREEAENRIVRQENDVILDAKFREVVKAQGEMIDEMMEGIKSLVDILNKAVQEETEKKPKHNKKK